MLYELYCKYERSMNNGLEKKKKLSGYQRVTSKIFSTLNVCCKPLQALQMSKWESIASKLCCRSNEEGTDERPCSVVLPRGTLTVNGYEDRPMTRIRRGKTLDGSELMNCMT